MWLLVSPNGLPLSAQPCRTLLFVTPPVVHGLPTAQHLKICRLGPKWWSGVTQRSWTGLLHPLSNSYMALAGDNPTHSADAPAAPSRPDLDSSVKEVPANSMGSPQLVAGGARVARCSIVGPDRQLSSKALTSASRRRILKEAVQRRSRGPFSHEPTVFPGGSDTAAPPQHSPVWSPHPQATSCPHSSDAACPLPSPANLQPSSPVPSSLQPL